MNSDCHHVVSGVLCCRWEQLLDVLLECELFTNQISAEGWPQAFQILASRKAFTRCYGVQSKLLSIQAVQQLQPDEAYAVMLTLAERGREFASAFDKITAARDISCEQFTTLLQLSMQHGNFTDVATLSRTESAEELDAEFVLRVAKRVLAGWSCGRTMYGQSEALSGLLTLMVAEAFTDEQCNELAAMALEQGEAPSFSSVLVTFLAGFLNGVTPCVSLRQVCSSLDLRAAVLLNTTDGAACMGRCTYMYTCNSAHPSASAAMLCAPVPAYSVLNGFTVLLLTLCC